MSKRSTLVVAVTAAVLALSVSACSSNNAYTNQQQASRTTTGAAAGAVTGAAIGAGVGSVPGAIIGGAAGGAVVGGGAGYAWDHYEGGVRHELRGTGVGVIEIEHSNDIMLVMPSNIRFKTGSAALSPAFQRQLNSVAKVMKQYKFTVAEIPGHTDSIGSKNYNRRLGAARAQAVADYLVSQGIDKSRVVPQTYGEGVPTATNGSTKGRAMNRRVEIILHTPPTTQVDMIKPVDGNLHANQ